MKEGRTVVAVALRADPSGSIPYTVKYDYIPNLMTWVPRDETLLLF